MKGIAANAMSHTYEVKIGVANPQKSLLPVCSIISRQQAATSISILWVLF
jgi:hypothetical protein